MNFIKKIYQYIRTKKNSEPVKIAQEINFSELIHNIHKNIIDSNKSLEHVGMTYIKKYFEKHPSLNEKKNITLQLNELGEMMATGDSCKANELMLTLKSLVADIVTSEDNDTIYRPKMTLFEVPVYRNGAWEKEFRQVPLFSLSPLSIPKIKELTFTSTLTYLKSEGDNVFVHLQQSSQPSHLDNASQHKSATKIKILFTAEQSSKEVNDVITQCKEMLRNNP